MAKRGWRNESARHSLAARGMKTSCPRKSRCAPHKSIPSNWKPSEKEIINRIDSLGAPVDKLPKNPAKYYREKYPGAWWPENIDWVSLKRDLHFEEAQEDMMGDKRKEIYFGDIRDATPSGAYYTPWAHGNVTEKQALADAWVMSELELHAEKRGMYIGSDENDPINITIGQVVK